TTQSHPTPAAACSVRPPAILAPLAEQILAWYIAECWLRKLSSTHARWSSTAPCSVPARPAFAASAVPTGSLRCATAPASTAPRRPGHTAPVCARLLRRSYARFASAPSAPADWPRSPHAPWLAITPTPIAHAFPLRSPSAPVSSVQTGYQR